MLRATFDWFFGRGDSAVTVPPMDGALRPNQRLEEAYAALAVRAPDNLVPHGGEVLFSSGRDLRKLATGAVVRSFDRPIACVAAAADGRLAVGLTGGEVVIVEADETVVPLPAAQTSCATALAFGGETLIVCRGSARHAADQWKRDLMETGATGHGTGSVVLFPRGGAPRLVAEQLRWPFGGLPIDDGFLVSESWAHRLLLIDPNGSSPPQPVLVDLPGYPARLAAAPDGAAWLAVFAPRSQLIEFVLREDGYRRRMISEIDSDYWIAPALANGRSFLEPIQGGALKQMGVLKPWAPSRTYGLIIKLDNNFEPILSLHSRADGTRHGTTSMLEHAGTLFVASKGGDVVLSIPTDELTEQ
jgi:hypothetical protein